jgi:DNA mismatch repair protein MutS2
MEFDTETLKPTYELIIGAAGRSNALEIADRLGLPHSLLDRARSRLDDVSEGEYGDMLEQVRQATRDTEKRRKRVQYLEEQAEELKVEYEERLARIKEEEERTGADIGLKMHEELQELKETAQQVHDRIQFTHKSIAKKVLGIHKGLQELIDRTQDLLDGREPERKLQAGDEVYVSKVHKWGEIERVDHKKGRAKVRAGKIQLEVEMDELTPWGEKIEGK